MTDVALTTRAGGQLVSDDDARTVQELTSRLRLIQVAMRDVMEEGIDYGKVTGGESAKPSLWKPGAEKLLVLFRLTAGDPEVETLLNQVDRAISYRVKRPILDSTGRVLAVGIGECSTAEEKYRWRRTYDDHEWQNALPHERREKLKGGRRKDGTEWSETWRQVLVPPEDVQNTVLKMASKRALIDGVLLATAAGSVFSQDVIEPDDEAGAASTRTGNQTSAAPKKAGTSRTPAASGDDAIAKNAISEGKRKRLFAICKEAGVSAEALAEHLRAKFPYTVDPQDGDVHISRISWKDYDAICTWVEGQGKAGE